MKKEKKSELEQDKEYIIYCGWYGDIRLSKKTFHNELLEYIKGDYTLDAYREVNKSGGYILKTIGKRKVKLYENENYELYVKKKRKPDYGDCWLWLFFMIIYSLLAAILIKVLPRE